MTSFDGKVVLITGGASGIGAEVARRLRRQGARLILCDLASMEAAVATGIERFGGIDIVMANAGITSYGSVLAVDPAFPGPMRTTTSVEACGRRFEKGIERRASRINVPGWVGALHWLRPLVQTPLAERDLRKIAPVLVPQMDAEVAGLGRSLGARTKVLEKG